MFSLMHVAISSVGGSPPQASPGGPPPAPPAPPGPVVVELEVFVELFEPEEVPPEPAVVDVLDPLSLLVSSPPHATGASSMTPERTVNLERVRTGISDCRSVFIATALCGSSTCVNMGARP